MIESAKLNDPAWVSQKLFDFCETDREKDYVKDHSLRYTSILNKITKYLKPGIKIASIGISILDPLLDEVITDNNAFYSIVLPDNEFESRFPNEAYRDLQSYVYDITSVDSDTGNVENKYDIILFYETLEHLLAPDDLVIRNISRIMKEGGILLGSVPNGLKAGGRINALLGKNVYWSKSSIIDGVFGGYGHIREYSFKEVREILSPYFILNSIYGENPYGSTYIRFVLDLLPNTFRYVIYFEGLKR